MELTDTEILHVARLARLRLTKEELPAVRRDLNRVLDYVQQLAQLDLSQVEPTMHVLKDKTPLREDQPAPSLPVSEALKNAPETADNMFQVPRIMEGGSDNG
ncbi:Asp-tRNA(Asn)/Glu-tRNA(Gln) amidotransferase subunit GatC [Sulfobacillus harzensis]|uniref:Aspartyl/glutamyl-tRNA(Asn/Gln) amidotransferase subunit C n=1 Tax=Sulfobacillus harzensis TaxID=2729629 RepID=A0A7Y0L440_9FIRM|nr:Asp-tRNA(Asn)/Glu-tRNA(Gln) amidotransferase subunit GatC [Sulfobacillus harzensis]